MPENKKVQNIPEYLHKKVVPVPLYGGVLVILLSNSPEKVAKYLPRFDDEFVFAHAIYEDYRGKRGYFCALNFNYPNYPMSPGTIAHEAGHLAMYVCESVGVELQHDNPEPYTYLVGWFADELHKFAKQKGFEAQIK